MEAAKEAVQAASNGSGISSYGRAGIDQEEDSAQGFGSPAATPVVNPSKHLNFDLKSAGPGTPSTPTVVAPASDESIDYNQFIMDTLLWTNKVRSGFYLFSGAGLILIIDYMLGHNIPLLTVVCHLTLAQMALNFLRHAISPSLQQKATWLDSAWTAAAIGSLAGSVKTLAAVHDKHLSASSPHKHLLIAVSLWLLSLLTGLIAPAHLALVLYIGAFIVPVTYTHFRAKIDPMVKDAFTKAKAQFDAADQRIKAGILMVAIMLLGLTSTANLVIAAFVACVFAHSQLPDQVEMISKKMGPMMTPIGNTAAKVGSKIGRAMNGAVEKFELTPTPQKKKKQ